MKAENRETIVSLLARARDEVRGAKAMLASEVLDDPIVGAMAELVRAESAITQALRRAKEAP